MKLNEHIDRKAWFYIPSFSELDKLREFAYSHDNFNEDSSNGVHGCQGCPQCKKGRLVITNDPAPMGCGIVLRCKWGAEDCNYELDITDYGMW